VDDKERRPQEWEDAFEAIADDPNQHPIELPMEVSPIDPLEDELDEYTPKYRSVQEAKEAFNRAREEKENND
jgi:hypothetical protein